MTSLKRYCTFIFLLSMFLNVYGQDQGIVKEEFIFSSAPFQSCHASTIAETSGGLIAAWFGGTAEKNKDVEIWISRLENNTWTTPESAANGINGQDRYPTWNPVLYQIPDGELILFYKVGPSPSEWWGMKKSSSDGGKTWSEAQRLPSGILGPIKNKPVLLENGYLICPSSTETDGWKVQMELTEDFGITWDSTVFVDHLSTLNVIQPTIILPRNGHLLQMLCRSKEGYIVTAFSADNGKTWGELLNTKLPNPNSGIDAVSHSSGKHFLVYNHSTVDPGKWGGPRHPLNLAVSIDGINWEAVSILESQEGEFSYPAIIESKDGLIHIVYTYNRELIKHVVFDPAQMHVRPLDVFNN